MRAIRAKKRRVHRLRSFHELASRLNLLLGNYHEKIFILGDGRSGTNWLVNLVNFDRRYRLVYEPFHGAEFRPILDAGAEYPQQTHHVARG